MMRFSGILLILILVSSPAYAGWLDAVKDSIDTIKGTGERSEPAGENDADAGNNKEPSREAEQNEPPKKAGPAESGKGSAATPDSSPATGEVYGNKFDFVPGEKVIFFEDFSDTDPGDYPSRWTTGEGGGPVEVVEYQGRRWLKSLADGKGEEMKSANSFMRVDLKKELPEKFTVEFDAPSTADMCIMFTDKYWNTGEPSVCFGPGYVKMYWANMSNDNFTESGRPLRHVSIAVSGTNVKTYFDGQRVLLAPDGVRKDESRVRTLGFYFPEGKRRQDLMFTNLKLAEGGKDYAKELVSGRIVTHGITFDTASDKLKPESGPTLRKILKLLQDNADLRFEVQGHTDNQGGDKINVPLSEKRAAAVKNWLVKQGIEESRLSTKGLGPTKPLDANDTPEGRANNRRVEFIKI